VVGDANKVMFLVWSPRNIVFSHPDNFTAKMTTPDM